MRTSLASALLLALASTFAASAQTTVEVQTVVKDRSSKNPVSAVIYSRATCVTYKNDCRALGSFDAKKGSPSNLKCVEGAQLFARIVPQGYYQESTAVPCFPSDSPLELWAARDRDHRWLTQTANKLMTQGNAAEATILFSQANGLAPSQALYEQTLTSAAAALGLSANRALVYDAKQRQKVASPELVEAIKKFQAKNGIVADGVLGSQTMGKLVDNRRIPEVIVEYAQTPPSP